MSSAPSIPKEVMARMRKVMAMQQSTNAHEAANAAGMLQRLLAKYQLSIADICADGVDVGEVVVEQDIATGKTKRDLTETFLLTCICSGLGAHCFCATIAGSGEVMYRVVAHRSDAEFVHFLFTCLLKRLSSEAKSRARERKMSSGQSLAFRNAFIKGAAGQIKYRLLQARATPAEGEGCTALVVAKEREVEAYTETHYSEAKPRKVTDHCSSASGFVEGVFYGNKVPLNRAVESEAAVPAIGGPA